MVAWAFHLNRAAVVCSVHDKVCQGSVCVALDKDVSGRVVNEAEVGQGLVYGCI